MSEDIQEIKPHHNNIQTFIRTSGANRPIEFHKADVVFARSGSPPMYVDEIIGDMVLCDWNSNMTGASVKFKASDLVRLQYVEIIDNKPKDRMN